MWLWWTVVLYLLCVWIEVSGQSIFDDGPWRLPVYNAHTLSLADHPTNNFRVQIRPTRPRHKHNNSTTSGSSNHLNPSGTRYQIPREIWITRKSLPANFSSLGWNIQGIITQNPRWHVHLVDDAIMNRFMEEHFANTSTLWAYKLIHRQVGVSRADMWRYAVLWLYGGLYIDDDAFFRQQLEEIVTANDSLIIASEDNPAVDVCFNQYFHLSPHYLQKHYPYHDILNDTVIMQKDRKKYYTHPLTGKVIVNWGIFSKPRHVVLYRALRNVVEIIKLEYFRWNVLSLNKFLPRWMYCVCGTGPYAFTSTVIESILMYGEQNLSYSYRGKDFKLHGGMSKTSSGSYQGDEYYGKLMKKHPIPLLGNYTFEHHSGRLIQFGKEINFVMNRTRYAFQDWDTFMYFNFSDHGKHVHKVHEEKWKQFPESSHVLTMKDTHLVYGSENEERRVYEAAFHDLV